PYALKAADADTLGGKPLSAFVLAGPDNTGNQATSTIDSGQRIVRQLTAAVSGAAVGSIAVTTHGGTNNKLLEGSDGVDGVAGDSGIIERGGLGGIGPTPGTPRDGAGTIRAAQQIASPEPLGASLIPNYSTANGFRSGFGTTCRLTEPTGGRIRTGCTTEA